MKVVGVGVTTNGSTEDVEETRHEYKEPRQEDYTRRKEDKNDASTIQLTKWADQKLPSEEES